MKALFLAIALVAPSFAFAVNLNTIKQIDERQVTCLEKAMSTASMKECVFNAYEAADKELNSVYKEITASLKGSPSKENSETLKRLIKAQRAWIAFRDADCDLAGTSSLGGSMETLEIGGCLADKTISRVKQLTTQLITGGDDVADENETR